MGIHIIVSKLLYIDTHANTNNIFNQNILS